MGLVSASLVTPLGKMVAIADDKALHYLGFEEVEPVALGRSLPIDLLEQQLKEYFEGRRQVFTVPYVLEGTSFQKHVWQALSQIPFGTTISYQDLAKSIGRPKSARALGNANGKNPLCIVVPCHRVIHHSGGLGGYSSGLERKQWLLTHEGKAL